MANRTIAGVTSTAECPQNLKPGALVSPTLPPPRLRERKQSIRCAIFILSAASFSPFVMAAETARPVFTAPPAATVTSGSILQVILSLLLVLAAVVLVAWVLKRINLPQQGAGSALKVISGVAVGQRERVVLVEVNDTWLVIGVAPGQVNALHSMPKGASPVAASNVADGDSNKFHSWLKQVMEKRDAH